MRSPTQRVVVGFLMVMLGIIVGSYICRALRSPVGCSPAAENAVVVAARDVQAGMAITDSSVKMAQPVGIQGNCLDDKSMVVNRIIILPIWAGECVVPSELAAENGDSFAALSALGQRAVSVSLKEMSDAASIRRGARVDVLILRKWNTNASTLLKNVAVIAVGPGAQDGSHGYSQFATLLVTPGEASMLASSRSLGQIALSPTRRPPD